MKSYFLNISIKWLQGLCEIILYLPFLLMIAIYFSQSNSIFMFWILSLPFCYLAGIMLNSLISRKYINLFFSVGAVLSGIFAMYTFDISVGGMLCWLIGLFMFYRGILIYEDIWSNTFPPHYMWIGLATYFFFVVFSFNWIELEPFIPFISWMCFLSIAICLIVTNRLQLMEQASRNEKERKAPARLVWRNNLILVGVLLFIIFVSAYSGIREAIIALIAKWFASLGSDDGASFDEPDMSMNDPYMGGLPPDDGGGISPIVVMIILGIAFLGFLIMAGKLGYNFIQDLIRIIKGLLTSEKYEDMYQAYEDEVQTIYSWKPYGAFQSWLQNMLNKEGNLKDVENNPEKVRFIYRHLLIRQMLQGFEYKPYHTPKEITDDLKKWEPKPENRKDMVEAYQKARYSNKEISRDEVEHLRRRYYRGK